MDADVLDGFEVLLPTKRFFGLETSGLSVEIRKSVDSTREGAMSYNGLRIVMSLRMG